MTVYDDYRPLRNKLRRISLWPSLYALHAYLEYFQGQRELPADIDAPLAIRARNMGQRVIFEWELEILVRELLINSPERGLRDFRSWNVLRDCIQTLRDLDDHISRRSIAAGHGVILKIFRLTHQQFPWQRRPGSGTLVRYYKIFGAMELQPILLERLGMTAQTLYTIGLSMMGHFLESIEWPLPIRNQLRGVPDRDLAVFIDRFSSDVQHLRVQAQESQSYDLDFFFPDNALLARPLIIRNRERASVLSVPIPGYLFRRFTSGIYYELYSHNRFGNAFGTAYQRYVGEVLSATTTDHHFIVRPEEEYFVGPDRKDSVDWILEAPDASVFIECKAKRLRFAAKFSSEDANALDEEINLMSRFVFQVYKTLSHAKAGLYPHWDQQDRPIYPFVVTLEEWFLFSETLLNRIDAETRRLLEAEGIDAAIMDNHPYTICSVHELEIALQVMALTGIAEFMAAKTRGEHKVWMLVTFSQQWRPEHARRILPNLFPHDLQAIGGA